MYGEVIKCNRCGLCQPTCPIYRITGKEPSVARGHHAHVREIVEGRFELECDLQAPIFECLMCKACTANCPAAVDIMPVMVRARAAYYGRHGRPAVQRLIFRGLLPRPGALALSIRFLVLTQRLGLSRLAADTGILGLLQRDLPRSEKLLDGLRCAPGLRRPEANGRHVYRRPPSGQTLPSGQWPTSIAAVSTTPCHRSVRPRCES